MTTLALYSNKGGVGKTATAVNLAYLSARNGHHTLLVDLDPQGAATYYFRVKPKLKAQARGLGGKPRPLDDSIKATDYEGLDILPADFSHRNLDIAFDRQKRSKRRLELALRHLRKEYEVIILDCPPTINLVAENIFTAADRLLVPLIPTTLSVHSHEQLLSFLAGEGRSARRVLAFFSMVDARRSLHQQLMASVRLRYEGVLRSVIPYLAQIEQMGVSREPVPAFAPKSRAARSYEALWAEIQEKSLQDRRKG